MEKGFRKPGSIKWLDLPLDKNLNKNYCLCCLEKKRKKTLKIAFKKDA